NDTDSPCHGCSPAMACGRQFSPQFAEVKFRRQPFPDANLPMPSAFLNFLSPISSVRPVLRQSEKEHPMEQVRSTGSHGLALILLVLVMLAGLPVAVWLDLRNLSESSLLRQAKDLNSVVSSVRSYYASNVV